MPRDTVKSPGVKTNGMEEAAPKIERMADERHETRNKADLRKSHLIIRKQSALDVALDDEEVRSFGTMKDVPEKELYKSEGNETGYLGVRFHENKYHAAYQQFGGAVMRLGAYRSAVKAAQAYFHCAKEHEDKIFWEFGAKSNSPGKRRGPKRPSTVNVAYCQKNYPEARPYGEWGQSESDAQKDWSQPSQHAAAKQAPQERGDRPKAAKKEDKSDKKDKKKKEDKKAEPEADGPADVDAGDKKEDKKEKKDKKDKKKKEK